MSRLRHYVVAGSLLVALPVVAQDQCPTKGSAENRSVADSSVLEEGTAAMIATMNTNMENMRKQMDRIRETTDPAERDRLLQDHARLMTWQMEMMKHMRGEDMVSGDLAKANRARGTEPTG